MNVVSRTRSFLSHGTTTTSCSPISRTRFDPFNHGTTTIEHRVVSPEVHSRLSRVLYDHWHLRATDIQQTSSSAEITSNNFRVVDSSNLKGNLKLSKINDPETQAVVNAIVQYCFFMELPVPTLIRTQNKKTYVVDGKDVFVLHYFIGGTHFDGSREELIFTAQGMARLHHVFNTMPIGLVESDQCDRRVLTASSRDIAHSVTSPQIPQFVDEKKGNFAHDRNEFEALMRTVRGRGTRTEFDAEVLSILDEVNDASRLVCGVQLDQLPTQPIHSDLHPHHVIFDPKTKELLVILDFDHVHFSQRARDIGWTMHRFARTYGAQTEMNLDNGADILDRARLFLEMYSRINQIGDSEVRAIPLLLADEAIRRVMIILRLNYIDGNPAWNFDLAKQVTMLREAALFENL